MTSLHGNTFCVAAIWELNPLFPSLFNLLKPVGESFSMNKLLKHNWVACDLRRCDTYLT